jgi:hypothetical protein
MTELKRMKHQVSHQVVADLLHSLGYSLQGNRKTKEGADHPDRNAQFEHLNGKAKWCLARRQPVISVDTKKKELVGDFSNHGQEWRPKGDPEHVRVHDFVDKELGRATPYGIYDIGNNRGWVIGARFAEVAPIPRFANQMFRKYADRILYGTDFGYNPQQMRGTFRLLESLDEHYYNGYQYHWACGTCSYAPVHARPLGVWKFGGTLLCYDTVSKKVPAPDYRDTESGASGVGKLLSDG